ncbi:AfsR/SARP family transcriptional regulator [Lentzea sp. HUAS TT2]|uniref:AfsR/SARP family transcriptional regulator n=1 Tax=Lentzea sp. HUAS TT2 TaxID=3447454 RepID=UPI003F7089E3
MTRVRFRGGGRQVRLVGAVAVHGSEGTWEALEVGSRKARTLLALLGASHGRLVTVETVVDELWAGVPPQQPEANVATLVSRLRAKFGPDVITGGRRGYRLGTGVGVDLHDAAGLVAQAEGALSGGRARAGLLASEQALELIGGGPVLADHPTSEWAEQARAWQAELLRRARHTGAGCALREGLPARARALAEAAIAVDPLDELAYGLLMRAHVAAGEPARALLAYERLRAALAAELGTVPVATTRDLHVAILRADMVSA